MAGFYLKTRVYGILFLFTLWISSCSGLRQRELATPLPQESQPTLVARTSLVLSTEKPTGTRGATPLPATLTPTSEETSEAPETPTPTVEAPAPTSVEILEIPTLPLAEATGEPAPFIPQGIPNNPIEIRKLGPLSRVDSPVRVVSYLKTGAGSQARIELLGEDRRLLFGETRVFNVPEGSPALLSMDIDFEIAAAAETARLQIYTQDEFGRVTALNSVPLILLSLGDSDINPRTDVLDPIAIQQPAGKALVQGGHVLVTGMARTPVDSPLLARLIGEDGRELGMRLANAAFPPEGGYGSFAVEVPYRVTQPTPALLVVSVGEADNADIIHLSSVEVLLSP